MTQKSNATKPAIIQLLHISPEEELRLYRLINRIWFFYNINTSNSQSEELNLIKQISSTTHIKPFDLLITDLRETSALKNQNREQLLYWLKKIRCPLITLSDQEEWNCEDDDHNWIHISLPGNKIEQYIEETNNAIANFWFCLPSLKRTVH